MYRLSLMLAVEGVEKRPWNVMFHGKKIVFYQ